MFDFLSQIFRRGNSRRFGNESPLARVGKRTPASVVPQPVTGATAGAVVGEMLALNVRLSAAAVRIGLFVLNRFTP
jgi:hypothetical protein